MTGNDKKEFFDEFRSWGDKVSKKISSDIDNVYTQLESLSWLQRNIKLKGELPPLRGWAASPDFLLMLHTHILKNHPSVVVEFGSGATTVIIADALRQNGHGYLISVENSRQYADKTKSHLRNENLESWVDLRVGELVPWVGDHLNTKVDVKPSFWYPAALVEDLEEVSLVIVDGPPASTCQFARYPALVALEGGLSDSVEIWMDDAMRREEKIICQAWSDKHNFSLDLYPLEKGLAILRRKF